jgi:hypothetical protein
MTRKRRLSIEFERREVTVTIRHSTDVVGPEDGGRGAGDAPTACRICGCPDLLPLGESMARYSGSNADLSLALTNGELHLDARGSELWVCERSFEVFKATRR